MTAPLEVTTAECVRLDGMRVPSGARFFYVKMADSMRLRVMRLPSRRKAPRGSVILVPGRAEFCEKYFEIAEDFRARGFTVMTVDHRGQGLSDRVLPRTDQGSYIDSFDTYVDDLDALIKTLKHDLPKPHVMVGHSMGGCIGLLGILRGKLNPDIAVFNAPMLGVVGLEQPFVTPLVSAVATMGLSKRAIPFRGQKTGIPTPFPNNKHSSDRQRHGIWRAYLDSAPRLRLAGPTLGWIKAAGKAMAFIKRNAVNLTVPTLIVAAGSDRIVVPEDVTRFAKTAKCELLYIPDARHEVFIEQDHIRAEFLERFDAFCDSQAV